MAKRHHVQFTANKKVIEPVQISFNSKKGHVSFTAHEPVNEVVQVDFMAKN